MWYAVQVVSGQEKQTADLCRAIISGSILQAVFSPRVQVSRRYHGEWKKVEIPMFPGYLIVITERISELNEAFWSVPKLTKLLKTEYTPVPLYEQERELLRRILNPQYVAEFSMGMIEGERLMICSGAMTGLEGYVKKIDRHRRSAVLEMEMFGRTTEVTLGLEVTRKVKKIKETEDGDAGIGFNPDL